MNSPDQVRVSTFVAVAPSAAFEIFTTEIDRWWRRTPRFRGSIGVGAVRFEGTTGGRLLEVGPDGTDFELGQVQVWEPGKRLVFGWRTRDFGAGERTEVDVRFEPAPGGTTVVLEHRGFAALPKLHSVRGGMEGDAFEALIGYYWAELLTSYRARCSGLMRGG